MPPWLETVSITSWESPYFRVEQLPAGLNCACVRQDKIAGGKVGDILSISNPPVKVTVRVRSRELGKETVRSGLFCPGCGPDWPKPWKKRETCLFCRGLRQWWLRRNSGKLQWGRLTCHPAKGAAQEMRTVQREKQAEPAKRKGLTETVSVTALSWAVMKG